MQPFGPNLDGWYDIADQLSVDLRARARCHFERRAAEKEALRSVEQFEAYRQGVRASFLDAMGGLPQEKTPLQASVTGTVERDGFVIEKLIYESSPGFQVTAACYVPRGIKEPAAAVVFVHGHADLGKSYSEYQKVCTDLANNGFVALAIDPIGQGERFQYLENLDRATHSCTVEHSTSGFPFLLQGASVARQFIWDVMRGIDYLETRPDVDSKRIGITGNSGGGTQTCLLMMSEPRLAAAMPCTFVMTLETMLKTGAPQDMEQIVRNCIVAGPDHDDFLTAMAPRPVCVGAVNYDFFPIEGSREAVRRARKVYSLYGAADRVEIVEDASHHAYSSGLRQAAVNFFKASLRGEARDFVTGTPDVLEPDRLWATRNGQILLDSPEARTIFNSIEENLAALPAPVAQAPEALRRALDSVLGVSRGGDRAAPIDPRPSHKLEPFEGEGLPDHGLEGATWEKVWFFSAPDIAVSGILAHPPNAAGQSRPATVLLLPDGTNQAQEQTPRVAALLRQGQRVLIFDVRGSGGVQARVVGSQGYEGAAFAGIFDTISRFAADAAMLGISLLGLRVFDVLRAFDYLRSRADVGSIELHGIGRAAPIAYFAAALEPGIDAVTTQDQLFSYADLCRARLYDVKSFNLADMAWGQLRAGDIVDFLPCLAPRPVTLIEPRDGSGQALTGERWESEFIAPARERGYLAGGWEPRREAAVLE